MAFQFARERLFGPLGISDVAWDADPQGHANPLAVSDLKRAVAELTAEAKDNTGMRSPGGRR